MAKFRTVGAALLLALPAATLAADDLASEVVELRQLLGALQTDYEQRIAELEQRLTVAERVASGARQDAEEAVDIAEQSAIERSQSQSAPNTFNPSIGAVIQGRYAAIDNGWDEIPGFVADGELGTGEPGFALGEAEINLNASIDSRFFGNLTLGVHEDEGETELGVEEAWILSTALPAGMSVTAGRFFSSAGYLNSFHFHADDFVDRPLPYQAFVGGRFSVDGIRASWIAPAALLVELGTEFNWGGSFPATANAETSPGAVTLYTKLGGDIGLNNSWQLGVSWLDVEVIDRTGGHADEPIEVEDSFSGDSELAIVDLVWKWAPGGSSSSKNFKLQGEYFSRRENGTFAGLPYDGDQQGWYLQTVWQFAPRWRLGLRYDEVDADNGIALVGTELETPGRRSSRNSLMFDWSPSEFSRLRLQYSNDKVHAYTGNTWYLQYIMSLGAHGAHQF
jgi:hypothetical protein